MKVLKHSEPNVSDEGKTLLIKILSAKLVLNISKTASTFAFKDTA